MCNHHHDAEQLVRVSRHRLERVFFGIAAFLTVLMFVVALSLSAYKNEASSALRENLLTEYRVAHPAEAELSDEALLEKLSADDQETLNMIETLEWWLVVGAPVALVLFLVYVVGQMYGEMRGNGVRVSATQFPEVHRMWVEMAQQLGMKKVPELYVRNGNGTLNAFATCIPGYREFGAIYSDILERALANNDEKALRFVLGHELGHIRLRHVAWWYSVLTFVSNFPIINYFIGLPLSRTREYGCDKLGLALSQDKEQRGLLMLAVGKHLYQQVNREEYLKEHLRGNDPWAALYNVSSSHPNVAWRIAALSQNRHGDVFWMGKPKG